MEHADMNAAELVQKIYQHGADVTIDGDDLNLTAAQALPAGLVDHIRDHKPELLDYLSSNAPATIAEPDGACPVCGSGQWWQLPGELWHCWHCELDMPLMATTLALPCHKETARHAPPFSRLRTLLETASRGLGLTPDALYTQLEAGGDWPDVEGGALMLKGLRLTAEAIAKSAQAPRRARQAKSAIWPHARASGPSGACKGHCAIDVPCGT
jgi:hypothetical protein